MGISTLATNNFGSNLSIHIFLFIETYPNSVPFRGSLVYLPAKICRKRKCKGRLNLAQQIKQDSPTLGGVFEFRISSDLGLLNIGGLSASCLAISGRRSLETSLFLVFSIASLLTLNSWPTLDGSLITNGAL